MSKDKNIKDQLAATKALIDSGHIVTFLQIFNTLRKTHLAEQIGMNYTPFKERIEDLSLFKLGDLFNIAHAIGVERRRILDLVMIEIERSKNKR